MGRASNCRMLLGAAAVVDWVWAVSGNGVNDVRFDAWAIEILVLETLEPLIVMDRCLCVSVAVRQVDNC
jgi:hypothetical protein